MGVSMAKGGDIIELGKQLKLATEKIEKTLPAGLSLVQVQDQPKAVTTSVGEFVHVLIEAVVIVLAVSFVSLGLHKRAGEQPFWRRYYIDVRPGLVVGITIPLVLAVTFLAMWYWGIGLHKISLGSLIIALGLLVDDLHAVTQFNPADIEPSPLALLSDSMLTTEVIKANQGRLLIQAVNAPRLFDWLIDGIEPPGLNPGPPATESSNDPQEALAA